MNGATLRAPSIFKKAIVDGNFEKALAIALKQVEHGAHVIDINMDDGSDRRRNCHVSLCELARF